MKALTFLSTRQSAAIAVLALTLASGAALAADTKLTGAQEVPPVKTSASGNEAIKVSPDGSVSGSVTTKGVDATMAHIHHGAAGSNGPVIIPLKKEGSDKWMVPADGKLTAEQMKAYREGNLYVNVHSEAHKGGEIRDQLAP